MLGALIIPQNRWPVIMSLASVLTWPVSPSVEMRIGSEIWAGRRTPHSTSTPCSPRRTSLGVVADGTQGRGQSPLSL